MFDSCILIAEHTSLAQVLHETRWFSKAVYSVSFQTNACTRVDAIKHTTQCIGTTLRCYSSLSKGYQKRKIPV